VRAAWILRTCVALAALAPAAAHADESEPPPKFYFYRDLSYGSASLDNPLYAMISSGYDTLQVRTDRSFATVKLVDMRNVVENFLNPFPAIKHDGQHGWGTFLRQEIFPLDWSQRGAHWGPNYSLHLIGGGETYADMREWFIAHGAPTVAATIFAIAANYVVGFVNESLENKGVRGDNSDCIADLWVFDVAGIVLFSFESVRRFFGETVRLMDWSLQPTLTLPHGDLQNVGAYYAMKIPLPFQKRVRLFVYGGYQEFAGLSIKLNDELSISAGGGVRISALENAGGKYSVHDYVVFEPGGGLFLDRNDSLLASLHVANVRDYTVQFNMYPNAFLHTDPGLGAWTAFGSDGKWMAGLSVSHAFGVGLGLGTR
jgi:hypothetical protein